VGSGNLAIVPPETQPGPSGIRKRSAVQRPRRAPPRHPLRLQKVLPSTRAGREGRSWNRMSTVAPVVRTSLDIDPPRGDEGLVSARRSWPRERHDRSDDDVIIASGHAVAEGVITTQRQLHVCDRCTLRRCAGERQRQGFGGPVPAPARRARDYRPAMGAGRRRSIRGDRPASRSQGAVRASTKGPSSPGAAPALCRWPSARPAGRSPCSGRAPRQDREWLKAGTDTGAAPCACRRPGLGLSIWCGQEDSNLHPSRD
jgi:hypothetical protein